MRTDALRTVLPSSLLTLLIALTVPGRSGAG